MTDDLARPPVFTSPVFTNPVRGFVQPIALMLSVYGACLLPPHKLHAQTERPLDAALTLNLPALTLDMDAAVRHEVQSALRGMDDALLGLTYARIYTVFREFLGHDDLSVARALIDYANLAHAELNRRQMRRPDGTSSPAEMALAYELVL